MNDMKTMNIKSTDYRVQITESGSVPGSVLAAIRKASVLGTLCSVLLISSCTHDEIIPPTPLAPQGTKTVTVDFQLPEGKPGFEVQSTDSRGQSTDNRVQSTDNRVQSTDSRVQSTDNRGQIAETSAATDGLCTLYSELCTLNATRATATSWAYWAEGDELLMTVGVSNDNNFAYAYLTLKYDGSWWDVVTDKSYARIILNNAATNYTYADYPLLDDITDLSLDEGLTLVLDEAFGEVTTYSVNATYAPELEWDITPDANGAVTDVNRKLKATATTTAPECWEVSSGEWSTNQARLRVHTGAAGDVVTLTSEKFYPNSIGKSADGIYTATTDADGNAYFYGEAGTIDDSDRITATTSGFNLSLTAVGVGEGDAAFTYHIAPVTLLEASTLVPVQLEAGKSYRLVATEKRTAVTNTIAVIDGTCGNISTGTDENVAAVKAAIAGKSTVIVTGETLAAYINTSANTVVGEAIRQLETSTTFSIVLPAATSIGEKAFNGCRALTSVSLPAAETIGYYAFQECTSLTSVSAPKATSIREYAFSSCTALTSVSAPVATTIRPKAFQECTALTSVELPAATSIRDYAFNGCSALTSVELPAATSIGYYAFQECTALASVSLPKVTTIGGNAFTNCTALTSLTFGEVITKVGTKAFDGTLADGTTAWTTQCDLTLGAGSIEDPEAGENEKWAGYTWKSITLVNSN